MLEHFFGSKSAEAEKPSADFESVVTERYFEGWDEGFDIEGNPGLKERLRANILYAEKENQGQYEKIAKNLGMSVEELKKRLQERVADMVGRSDFFRATHVDVLEQVMLNDGRWKSQFETASSNGKLSPKFRAAAEMSMFAFNHDAAPGVTVKDFERGYAYVELPQKVMKHASERRPIYGYFSDDTHGAINARGTIPPPNAVNQYGLVNFKIRRERALRKATTTFQDSLDTENESPPSPAVKPHFTSFKLGQEVKVRDFLKKATGPSVVTWAPEYGGQYTEVQFHDQLTMDDVESIHLSAKNGVNQDEMEKVRRIFIEYKKLHPESTIQLIEF